eukprot:2326854-Prorocentrum_lima.AAC.2
MCNDGSARKDPEFRHPYVWPLVVAGCLTIRTKRGRVRSGFFRCKLNAKSSYVLLPSVDHSDLRSVALLRSRGPLKHQALKPRNARHEHDHLVASTHRENKAAPLHGAPDPARAAEYPGRDPRDTGRNPHHDLEQPGSTAQGPGAAGAHGPEDQGGEL